MKLRNAHVYRMHAARHSAIHGALQQAPDTPRVSPDMKTVFHGEHPFP